MRTTKASFRFLNYQWRVFLCWCSCQKNSFPIYSFTMKKTAGWSSLLFWCWIIILLHWIPYSTLYIIQQHSLYFFILLYDRRHLEQFRRLFLHCFHSAPVLHQRRQILRHISALDVPYEDYSEESCRHVGQHLDLAGPHLLPSHLPRMVYIYL